MLYNNLNFECAKFTLSGGFKPELEAVFFTKDKTVATDSFRLLEITTDQNVKPAEFPQVNSQTAMQGFQPFMVSGKAIKEVAKMKRGNATLPILDYVGVSFVDDKQVKFIATDLESGSIKVCQKTQGTFPKYEEIFPTKKPVIEFSVNGKLMAEILETLGKFNKLSEVKIKVYGENEAIAFEAKNKKQSGRALLMPIRADRTE